MSPYSGIYELIIHVNEKVLPLADLRTPTEYGKVSEQHKHASSLKTLRKHWVLDLVQVSLRNAYGFQM
jgi:hypothetical protein